MGGFVITEGKLPAIPAELLYKWKTNNFHFIIEDIYKDLKSVFSDEQLQDLEPNYVGFAIAKKFPSESIPAEFLNKTAAIIAMNVNPYEYTCDMIAFANVAAVTNDVSMMGLNVGTVPPRYLSRMLTAVQGMTPKNWDFDSIFYHNNIQNYIFQCYYTDSFYLIDDRFAEDMGMQFLNNAYLPPETNKLILELRPMTKDFKEMLDSKVDEKIFEDPKQKEAVEEIFDGLAKEQGITEFMKDQMRKYTSVYLYNKYYKQIYDKLVEK